MTSLVHPEGTVCRWCYLDDATTTVYSTPTCVECASSRHSRVRRWLQNLGRAIQGAR